LNKIFLLISIGLSAIYVALSESGIAGIETESGGLLYRLIVIAALLFCCVRAFGGANGGGAALAGALGLGVFAVNEVYAFAYIYLLGGNAGDVTVANISRNCAYLFFLTATLRLIPRAPKFLRAVLSALSSVAMLLIFYGVIADIHAILYYPALGIMVLCTGFAVYLLIRGDKPARIFAGSVIAVGLIDSLNRILVIFDFGHHWRDVVLSLFPPAYLLICFALIGLKREEEASYE